LISSGPPTASGLLQDLDSAGRDFRAMMRTREARGPEKVAHTTLRADRAPRPGAHFVLEEGGPQRLRRASNGHMSSGETAPRCACELMFAFVVAARDFDHVGIQGVPARDVASPRSRAASSKHRDEQLAMILRLRSGSLTSLSAAEGKRAGTTSRGTRLSRTRRRNVLSTC